MAATNPGKRGTKVVIEKRGSPNAVLLSIRDYAKLAAPEPAVLRVIGQESERNGTSTFTSRSDRPDHQDIAVAEGEAQSLP